MDVVVAGACVVFFGAGVTGLVAAFGAAFAGVAGAAGFSLVAVAGPVTAGVEVDSTVGPVVTGVAVAGAEAGGAVTGFEPVEEFCVVGGACADVRGLASSNKAAAMATGTLARKTRMR